MLLALSHKMLIVHDAYVRCHDPPALGEPDPALLLSPDLARGTFTHEQRARSRKVAAERRDYCSAKGAIKPGRCARTPKLADLINPVERFWDAVAHRALVVPKQIVQCREIVADQRTFVSRECLLDLFARRGHIAGEDARQRPGEVNVPEQWAVPDALA